MAGVNNKREEIVKNTAEELGWEVLGKGWPDFMLIKGRMCIMLEVKAAKSQGARLRKEQKQMHRALKQIGVNVKVIRVGRRCSRGNVLYELRKILPDQYFDERVSLVH